jgi:hypothetical protein
VRPVLVRPVIAVFIVVPPAVMKALIGAGCHILFAFPPHLRYQMMHQARWSIFVVFRLFIVMQSAICHSLSATAVLSAIPLPTIPIRLYPTFRMCTGTALASIVRPIYMSCRSWGRVIHFHI